MAPQQVLRRRLLTLLRCPCRARLAAPSTIAATFLLKCDAVALLRPAVTGDMGWHAGRSQLHRQLNRASRPHVWTSVSPSKRLRHTKHACEQQDARTPYVACDGLSMHMHACLLQHMQVASSSSCMVLPFQLPLCALLHFSPHLCCRQLRRLTAPGGSTRLRHRRTALRQHRAPQQSISLIASL